MTYPISEIDGLPTFAANKLKAQGIRTTDALLEAASTVTQPTRVALAASRAAGWMMGECPRKRCIMSAGSSPFLQ